MATHENDLSVVLFKITELKCVTTHENDLPELLFKITELKCVATHENDLSVFLFKITELKSVATHENDLSVFLFKITELKCVATHENDLSELLFKQKLQYKQNKFRSKFHKYCCGSYCFHCCILCFFPHSLVQMKLSDCLKWHLFEFLFENEVLGTNDENLENFSVTKDITFITGRWLLWNEKILVTKFYLCRKSTNGIKKVCSKIKVTTFIMATKI